MDPPKGFIIGTQETPMNRMAPENLQEDSSLNMNDLHINLMPQDPASPSTWKKHQERTIFTQKQHEELEALFSQNMFPDKILQKELALKLNLHESTVKVWFRNRRFKLKKQQQQQQSQKQPNHILPAMRIMPTSPRTCTNPHIFPPVVSDFYSSPPSQPLDPSNGAWGSVFTESPTSGFPMEDPLVASVPALYSDVYDIAQIIDLYSFPDEDETSSSSFHCLYQYLSPTGSQQGEQGSSLQPLCPSSYKATSRANLIQCDGPKFCILQPRDSLEFQSTSSMVDLDFSDQNASK